jgi:hypothetical protein
MKHPLNNLRDAAEHIRLSDQEKSLVRAHLVKMVRLSEAQARPKQPVATPYFFFFSFQRLAMPMAVLLIVALGGTTTYAAQGSLPGGVLYPVKIYVNENIQEALAVSEKAKVSFHTSVAEERLMEAEALASEGKLDAQTSSNIEANFNDHVAKADTIAATLEESDPASGVEARATLDSSIAAHSSILARIGDNSSDEQTKENSNSIAMRARSREQGGAVLALKAGAPVPAVMQTMSFSAEATSDAPSSDSSNADRGNRTMAKKAVAVSATATVATDTASQKKVALQLQKKASAQFDTAQESLSDSRSSLDASTTLKVKAQLSAIGNKFDAGRKEIKAENYDAARADFTEVIRASVELHTLIDASKLYKRDLIRSLLWGNSDDSQDTHSEDSAPNPTTTVSSPAPSSTPVKNDTKKEDIEGQSGSDVHINIHL